MKTKYFLPIIFLSSGFLSLSLATSAFGCAGQCVNDPDICGSMGMIPATSWGGLLNDRQGCTQPNPYCCTPSAGSTAPTSPSTVRQPIPSPSTATPSSGISNPSTSPAGSGSSGACTDGTNTGFCATDEDCDATIFDVGDKCGSLFCCTQAAKKATGIDNPQETGIDNSTSSGIDNSGTTSGTSTPVLNGIEIPSGTGLPDRSIQDILVGVLQWLLRIFLLLAVIAFIITGIQFLVAMGNSYSGAAQNAKKNFGYAVLAVAVVGSSYIIIITINFLLGG